MPGPPSILPAKEFRPAQGRGPVRTLAKGEVHSYLFDLDFGDFLDLVVEQNGLDVAVNVFAPGKLLLFTVDSLNGASGPESIPLLAEGAGRYTVEIVNGGRGTYWIAVPPKRKTTARDRQNFVGALAYSGGKELLRKGQSRPAEREFERALASWKEADNLAGQADASYQLEKLMGGQNAALPLMEQASALYHQLGNGKQEVNVLMDQGSAHLLLGHLDQALASYQHALSLTRGLRESEMNALVGRGLVYSKKGEYGKAIEDFEASLAMSQTSQSFPVEVAALNALGSTYSSLGDFETALHLHGKVLAVLKTHPNEIAKAETLAHVANIYRTRGDLKRAVPIYLRALISFQSAGNVLRGAAVLNNLGLTYYQMKRYTEALGAFQQCQGVYKAQRASGEEAVAWTNLGWVLTALERYGQAAAAYQKSLGVAGDQNLAPTTAAAYFGWSWTEWRRGNLIAARSLLERSILIMESMRTNAQRAKLRTSYLAGKHAFYELLVEILMDQDGREPAKGYDLKAFEASEKGVSRSLLDSLEGQPVVPALSVQDIQRQVLGPDEVLLEYSLGDNRSFLWVATPTSFTSYTLPPRVQIEALAQEVHKLLRASNRREVRSLAIRKATDLSRVLFGPVAGRLKGKNLLIVAPPALQYISFGALPEGNRQSRRTGLDWPTPWIANHEIVVEPSATVLASLRRRNGERRPSSGSIAILADPVFSSSNVADGPDARSGQRAPYPKLRFSRSEAQAIAEVAPGDKNLMALGFDANRQMVLNGGLKDYGILHFSTHGLLDTEVADRSALVLSLLDRQLKPIDGFLKAGEIAKLKLPADLVVLSACQTGLGREVRGEGLVGLTQAFFSAGASRVMVSLWDVDEQPTAILMEQFYSNLFENNLSPAAALHEAQAWMWRQPKWNAPSYWAGFVLQGEWQ